MKASTIIKAVRIAVENVYIIEVKNRCTELDNNEDESKDEIKENESASSTSMH